MKRRTFLQMLGVGVAAPAIARLNPTPTQVTHTSSPAYNVITEAEIDSDSPITTRTINTFKYMQVEVNFDSDTHPFSSEQPSILVADHKEGPWYRPSPEAPRVVDLEKTNDYL